MMTPFTFLITPRKVYEKIKLRPHWVVPFVIAVVGLILKTFLSNTWGTQSFFFQVHSLYLYVIITTILVIILWSAISIFLYLSIFLINTDNNVTYKSLFSIVSYCGLIFLLGEISNYLLISTDIIDSMLYTIPKRFPIGLDLLTLGNSPPPALAIFLHSINPFSIWYFTLLSMGLSIVTDLSKPKARLLSFIVWLIAVGLAMSVLLITGETSLRIKI
jgi:hypothetical protein